MTKSDNRELADRIKRAFETVRREANGDDAALRAVKYKTDGSAVTKYDLLINDILRDALKASGDGWISEESPRVEKSSPDNCLWIVDPVDGTNELAKGLDEWVVSVAALRNGEFAAAGVCNPRSGFSLLSWRDASGAIEREQRNVKPPPPTDNGKLTVLISKTELGDGLWRDFASDKFELRAVGSIALKLAKVACGEADFAATLKPKKVWDIAAGVILVVQNGGEAADARGGRLRDCRAFINGSEPGLTACNQRAADSLDELGDIIRRLL